MNATTPTTQPTTMPTPATSDRADTAVPRRCPNCRSVKSVRTLADDRLRCGCGHRWTQRKEHRT